MKVQVAIPAGFLSLIVFIVYVNIKQHLKNSYCVILLPFLFVSGVALASLLKTRVVQHLIIYFVYFFP